MDQNTITRKELTESQRMQWIAWGVSVLLIVVGGYFGVHLPELPPIPMAQEIGSRGTTNLDSLALDDDLTVGDDLTVTGATTSGEALTVTTGGIEITAGVLGLSFTDLAVSDGDTITPTYSVYALDTSGAVTITLAASANEGQLLLLINDDANATIIADTNLRSSDGNAITLAGANDAALFVYQDSEWVELLSIAGS